MEMRQLLEAFGLERAAPVASLIGAVCSLRFVDRALGWPAKLVMVVIGYSAAAYGTPLLVQALGLQPSAIGGISFFAGLFGMSLVDAIHSYITDGTLLNIIRGRLGQ